MPSQATPDDPALVIKGAFDLPPADAIKFFESKGYQTSVNWAEMWHDDHARAFTVAKIAQTDLLISIRQSLDKAMADGVPFEQWQAEIQPTLAKAGWIGLVTDEKLTGTSDPVFIGPRRLRTIYDTNLRTARAAGQWARIQAIKAKRPFLRYSAVMDRRTRPAHAAWHGTVLPVDHPWWQTHFPPCGWRCRCTAQQLSQRDLDHHGWKVSAVPPEGPPRLFYRPGKKTPEIVPNGIDPGFAYNPGEQYVERMQQLLGEKQLDLPLALPPIPGSGMGESDFGHYDTEAAHDLNARAQRYFDKGAVAGIDDEQVSALNDYSQTGYDDINGKLWRGESVADVEDQISAIERAIASHRLPENVAVWHGMREDHFDDLRAAIAPGDETMFLGFTSSSFKRDIAVSFAGRPDAIVKILMPKGSPFFPMNANGISEHSHEHEILLQRSSVFVIREIRDAEIVLELLVDQ